MSSGQDDPSERGPHVSPARRGNARHVAVRHRGVRKAVRELGLEMRAGIHTGECERIGEKLAGIAT
jgi:hypothetical protein